MITNERAYFESQVLDDHAPRVYRFFNLPAGVYDIPNTSANARFSGPAIVLAALTNRKNIYNLFIDLKDFPESIPEVYVMKMLHTRDGQPMTGASNPMHTLGNYSHPEWTRICHYGASQWKPNISLFKVFVRARLWLEMYELHLQTGNNIDYYLRHAT